MVMEEEYKPDLYLSKLREHFGGTQNYYYINIPGPMYITDGVKYIMENGYSWFVTDAIAVIRYEPKVRKVAVREGFLVVRLKLGKDETADMIIEDGDGNVIYKQHYSYTDAKRELKLFYSWDVLMLDIEY